MNLNTVTIEGNLTDDPKLTHVTRGMTAVSEAVVLVNRRTKDTTGEWTDAEPTRHRIKAGNQIAENLATLHKGARVLIIGHIETDTWEDPDTHKKRTADIVVVDAVGVSLRFNTVTPGHRQNSQNPAPEVLVGVDRRFLTPNEAAHRLGIAERDLAYLRAGGNGPDWLTIGRTIRYSNADLQWWLRHRPTADQ